MQNYHANLKLKIAGLLAASVAFLPATSQAEDDAVFSVNIVGFQRLELPVNGFMFASMPFETPNNTLSEIFGTNTLRKSSFLASTDKIIIYDPLSFEYQRWAQRTDGIFYKANNATEWSERIAGDPVVPRGGGFWIASASGTATNTITFVGNIVSDPSTVVDLVAGIQIVGYPFSTEFSLANTEGLVASGASKSSFLAQTDRITVYDPKTSLYQRYALRGDGIWYKANDAAEWGLRIAAEEIIPAGSAFWYEARNGFAWEEPNPYIEVFQD
jgi:hypothetical protein